MTETAATMAYDGSNGRNNGRHWRRRQQKQCWQWSTSTMATTVTMAGIKNKNGHDDSQRCTPSPPPPPVTSLALVSSPKGWSCLQQGRNHQILANGSKGCWRVGWSARPKSTVEGFNTREMSTGFLLTRGFSLDRQSGRWHMAKHLSSTKGQCVIKL